MQSNIKGETKFILVIDSKNYSFPVINGVANIYMPELNDGNYNYSITYSGDGKGITPVMAFDNGKKTFFRFANNNAVIPVISSIDHMGRETPIRTRISGEYVYVDTVENQFTLRKGPELVCVFNEEDGSSGNRKIVAQAD